MSFKDDVKVGLPDRKILIIEDRPNVKIKRFLRWLSEGYDSSEEHFDSMEYYLTDNLEDGWQFYINNLQDIDIVILDCAVPRESGQSAALYAGLEIMDRLIRRKNDISIILNTPSQLGYEAVNRPNNLIYTSKNTVYISKHMIGKTKTDRRLSDTLKLLRINNGLVHPKSPHEYYEFHDPKDEILFYNREE